MEIVSPNARFYYGISIILIGLISLVGYSVFFRAIWNRKDLQRKSIWMTSLAASDLIMMIHLSFVVMSTQTKSWPFGNVGCQINAFVGLAAGFINIASITWVAIDRYYRTCQPEKFGLNYVFFMGIVWGLSTLAASLPALGFGYYETVHENTVGCLVDLEHRDGYMQAYIILVALLWFIYPAVKMMIYCKKLLNESKHNEKAALIAPMLFLICYTPYAVYAGLQVTIGVGNLPVWLIIFVHLLPKTIIACNPYLYIQSDPEILQACRDVVHWKNAVEIKEE